MIQLGKVKSTPFEVNQGNGGQARLTAHTPASPTSALCIDSCNSRLSSCSRLAASLTQNAEERYRESFVDRNAKSKHLGINIKAKAGQGIHSHKIMRDTEEPFNHLPLLYNLRITSWMASHVQITETIPMVETNDEKLS